MAVPSLGVRLFSCATPLFLRTTLARPATAMEKMKARIGPPMMREMARGSATIAPLTSMMRESMV